MICKIKHGLLPGTYEVQAAAAVTIKLCKNEAGDVATVVEFACVQVTDHVTHEKINDQPSSIKATSFDLNLKVGSYDVAMTIRPAAGASLGVEQSAYVCESCDHPVPLAYIDTSICWEDSFKLEVK